MTGEAHAPTLEFLGGTGTVTGSKHLLRANGRSVLLDCGLFQGLKPLRLRNWARLPFDPAALHAVVLSHAHLDHSGALPLLVRQGFRGSVHCTPGTRDLLHVLLPDAAYLEEEQAAHANAKGWTKHHPALPLFTAADAARALERLVAHPYGRDFDLGDGTYVRYRQAGHILGSATVELRIPGARAVTLVFSGDLGRPGQPILNDPEPVPEADVLLLESTYGDRHHPPDPAETLVRIVREAVARGGALLIPAFAVGRTQQLIWMLHELEAQGRIPRLPAFLDSPMANQVSTLTCRHGTDLDAEMRRAMAQGRCPICTQRFTFLPTAADSKSLNAREGPFIVIAGSGMATGGRILHHLAWRLGDPRTTVLFAGYQAAGTRGRALQDGAREVRIHGRQVPVAARIETVDGLSAHADQGEILAWLAGFTRPPGRTYLVHGEPGASAALAAAIRQRLGWSVAVAEEGQRVPLAMGPRSG